MTKIRNPKLFSNQFDIDPTLLNDLGVLNPILNVDTRLFIDPLLLKSSVHSEINTQAFNRYNAYFEIIIKLLRASKQEDDLAWRNAEKKFRFREIKETCLGYSSSTIHGSGWGPSLRKQTMRTAKEIIELGVDDPDLFIAISLFEEGMGPDRISDMVTNIIFEDLIDFNHRILSELSISMQQFKFNGRNVQLAHNPLEKNTPILLVPRDILRDLPTARDWSEVGEAARKNRLIRNEVSQQIGKIWETKTRKDKSEIRNRALSSKQAFLSLLKTIENTEKKPYNFISDKKGEIVWTRPLEREFIIEYPLTLSINDPSSITDVFSVVKQIVQQFKVLIESKGLWKELWNGSKPRLEKAAQRLFFAVADTYCKSNNIDVTPEADSGGGPVDFKFACNYNSRVLVEIKLSTNPNIVEGYRTQLETYKAAEETQKAVYLIIDVGRMGKKDKKVLELKNQSAKNGLPFSEIVFVDGTKKLSASKK